MRLTGGEFTALHQALSDAFVTYEDLDLMMAMSGRSLADIGAPGPKRVVVMKVIQYAAAGDWVEDLVAAARSANPGSRTLTEVAAAIGLEPAGVLVTEGAREQALPAVKRNLERLVDASRGLADFGTYAVRIHELLRRICAVEIGREAGTGFLIGPRTVLTNHHVVKRVIDGQLDPRSVTLRFDYRRIRDGKTVNAGVEVRLADGDEWLVDAAPPSSADTMPYDDRKLPAEHELDYAVLRTAETSGLQKLAGPSQEKRGWIEPFTDEYEFPADSALMIVQHPCNDPISYDSSPNAVLRVNPNGTRVHYRTNTMPGSSGSPVLNPELELVALHHAGEPGSPDHWKPCHQQATLATYNEGIPIAAIRRQLKARNMSWVFGSDAP